MHQERYSTLSSEALSASGSFMMITIDNFVARLTAILPKSTAHCYAWALIPDHLHLLFRTGKVPIATVMRRLLTGYALRFNRRHRRHGPLFQNRYKSILCVQKT
jgi:REP element-mobilizing transposase RayT